MDNKLLYDREVSQTYEQLGAEHKIVLKWVKDKRKVLEMGCHTGYFSAWLQRQGNEVTGVEMYEPALKKAVPYLHRSILGNIENTDVWERIAGETYDAILFMHILEHLVNPEEILKKAQSLLRPGGKVIIALPNISNWVNRWDMLKGNFTYTDTGVMDRTHLRFYNYFTAQELFKKCGYQIEEYNGESWKVRFLFLPQVRGIGRINALYNKLWYRFGNPNFTDKITTFRISKSRDL